MPQLFIISNQLLSKYFPGKEIQSIKVTVLLRNYLYSCAFYASSRKIFLSNQVRLLLSRIGYGGFTGRDQQNSELCSSSDAT